MNAVHILGNITQDVELRYTRNGKPVAQFSVAVTTQYVDSNNEVKEQTAFVRCVAWGKLGEAAAGFRKGNRVFITGKLTTRSYEGKDGVKRYITEVNTDFIGSSLLNSNSDTSNFDEFATVDEEIPF